MSFERYVTDTEQSTEKEQQPLLFGEEREKEDFELQNTQQTNANPPLTTISTNPFDKDTNNPRSAEKEEFLISLPQVNPQDLQPVKYNRAQWLLQAGIHLVNAAVPPYLLGQVLPKAPDPYADMLAMVMFPANGLINQMIEASVFKQNPLDGLRALGPGTELGVLKEFTTHMTGFGLVAIAGYGANVFIQSSPHSANENIQVLGAFLSEDAFKVPLFGVTGYLLEKGIYTLGMKFWDCCSPAKSEKIKNDQDLNFLQKTLGYGVRFFIDASMTETVLYYLNKFGQEAGQDPRIQIAIFLSADVASQLGKHFAFVPHPIDSLTPMNPTVEYSDDPDDVEVSTPTKWESRGKFCMTLGFLALGFYGATYLFNRVTCGIAGSYGSDLCTNDTLENRVILEAASIGGPMLIEHTIHNIIPPVKTAVSKCWSSLFSSGSRASTAQELDNAEELRNSNTNTYKLSVR